MQRTQSFIIDIVQGASDEARHLENHDRSVLECMAKIALYHPWIYLKGGAERFILETVRNSKHDWTIFTHHYEPKATFPEFSELDVRELRRVSVKRSFLKSGMAALAILFEKLPRNEFDALMVSSEGLGDLITFRNHNIPLAVYCHTPLKVLHDPNTKERWLALHGKASGVMLKLFGNLFTTVDRHAWKHYDSLMCNSSEVANRLLEAGLVDICPKVINPGVQNQLFSLSTASERKYFLIPGRIMWTKNVEAGISAFIDSRLSSRGYGLKIAGMVDEKSKPYYEKLRGMAEGHSSIEFVVEPTQQEMHGLYANAFAVLFTPPNEDFGIVMLEGMAASRVVIAPDRGGPREVIEDGISGLLCDGSPGGFAEKMLLLANSPGLRELIEASARSVAKSYSWSSTVRAIDNELTTLIATREVSRGELETVNTSSHF